MSFVRQNFLATLLVLTMVVKFVWTHTLPKLGLLIADISIPHSIPLVNASGATLKNFLLRKSLA
jgi:hypothetical protein